MWNFPQAGCSRVGELRVNTCVPVRNRISRYVGNWTGTSLSCLMEARDTGNVVRTAGQAR